ncbi:hypothetical protein GQF61_15935 [Sphingobacterium sp. DK4209]|uniref:Uncharacterized protein n=1 Tax=Sphingobacterium zhuxiongii TaxID=2662364 RepID=A0A5Q0QBK5_9SPHI|nr:MULTISPECIES: hypothetical protein [unclassified Sphingobacterium]MVZ67346.1 hypothetical protein [Sphingobacterium sp. DK4209]QGA26933.1 hypothetical protein GFH32_11675 [Sphingobacterium sp. dk4302]
MTWNTLIVVACIFLNLNASLTSLDSIRSNFKKVVEDKDLCKKMIDKLSENYVNLPIRQAYLGGYQTIWANHTFSPISKLKTFKTGKKNIELAIEKAPSNAEIRFIRLSIQKNTPAFLGYQTNIKEDSDFIKKNKHQITSMTLLKDIEAILNR